MLYRWSPSAGLKLTLSDLAWWEAAAAEALERG
jgi:hypothetical protein